MTQRRPAGGGGRVLRRVLVAITLALVLVIVVTGTGALVFAVGAYNHYAAGLPDPKEALENLHFDQQTSIYDRTGKIELAKLGALKREVVTFDQIPGEMIDATTAIEDKDFWANAGFDPVGIVSAGLDTLSGRPRGASTITQQLVRARLLPPEAFEGSTYDRKVREIIQSYRLTQAYPGTDGKQQIIAAYLNQNFYGNSTYGAAAAARGYFGKPLKDLSLAQFAILAAIPQSPSKFDLMKNSDEVCTEPVAEGDECKDFQLVVDPSSEVVQRRDYILDLMKTRSTLTGSKHSSAEYDDAKQEPVVLTPPPSANWKAAHFVWQVRDALAKILCPDKPDNCDAVDSGGYRVTTSLDYEMQKTVEKWVYVASRGANSKTPRTIFAKYHIPRSDWGWLLNLRGRNIHNAAAAVVDYRTGEVLAYQGSGSYTSKGTRRFQPQFDVLADGWRQPGSSIKPLDYLVGIDDKTLTASTVLMDVVTNFGGGFTPKQADNLERGPVRLRSALQFSLNIPAIKGAIMIGLDHVFDKTQTYGINYLKAASPVLSMGIGTLETHPIDMLTGYAMIANNGVKMPRTMIESVVGPDGRTVWDAKTDSPKGQRVAKAQAAYIITDILAGNTQPKVNKYWAEWAIYDHGNRRPAAYKTGTTSDNHDVHAYGYLAPPKESKSPALAVGVWMGNSDNTPNNGSLSLDSSAPVWSRIMTEISKGRPIADFSPPPGLKTAKVDAFTGMKPGPYTKREVTEFFLDGTVPKQSSNARILLDIDAASGLRWQDGCVGPRVTRAYFDVSELDANFPTWQRYDRAWAARAAAGPGVRGGPEGTATTYFYNGAFTPFGRTWGAPFAPRGTCPLAPPPPVVCDPLFEVCPPPEPGPGDGGGGGGGPGPDKSPKPTPTPKH